MEHEPSRGRSRAAHEYTEDVLEHSSDDEDSDMQMAFNNIANPEDDMF
jgi:hypothetical protein